MKGLHERKPNFGTAATKRWQCYRGQLKIIAEKVRKKTIKVLKYRKKSKILANFEIRTRAVFNEHKNFFVLGLLELVSLGCSQSGREEGGVSFEKLVNKNTKRGQVLRFSHNSKYPFK